MFATVFVTVPNEGTAERIAEDLITKRLAACANFFPTRSMYSWKGNFEKGEEYIMLLKIRSADFLMVAKAIARNHPYEVPCIVKYDIAAGFKPYLDWIKESTDRSLEG